MDSYVHIKCKATPNQFVVSHPPSALELMRAAFLAGNGRQNHKFNNIEHEAVYFCTELVLAGTNGNTCERKLRGDEKQLIDLEWSKVSC